MDANNPAAQSFPGDQPFEHTPIQDGPTQGSPTQQNPTQVNPVQESAIKENVAPARPKGPNVSAVVLGLVSIVLAGLIIASETTGLRVDWSQLGPGAIVGIGALFVVLGAIGLVRRHDGA